MELFFFFGIGNGVWSYQCRLACTKRGKNETSKWVCKGIKKGVHNLVLVWGKKLQFPLQPLTKTLSLAKKIQGPNHRKKEPGDGKTKAKF